MVQNYIRFKAPCYFVLFLMKFRNKSGLSFVLVPLLLLSKATYSEPWFTGPILAPSGETTPMEHVNVEIYDFATKNNGVYNRHGKLTPSPSSESNQYQVLYYYGFTTWMDMQLTLPYVFNSASGHHGQGYGDTGVLLGFQILRQNKRRWMPDLRVSIQETLPSGRYDMLNPAFFGTGLTGKGSYQTTFTLAFQHLTPVFQTHYFRTRFTVNYTIPGTVNIQGLSAYAGSTSTQGHINPGSNFSLDLAAEYTVTQNWVAVMEGYYFYGNATRFRGEKGITKVGKLARVGYPDNDEISLAPAIEYNFSNNVGIIAGYWYSIAGRKIARFRAPTIALNLYW